MTVEGGSGDHHACGESELRRPLRRERSDRNVGGVGVGVETRTQARQQRVDSGEELFRRQPAPGSVPERLVPGGAAAAGHGQRIGAAAEFARDPVAVFDPAEGGFAHGSVDFQRVENLAPDPFAGVDAALVHGVVGSAVAAGEFVDAGGFGDGGMVFPENEHGVGILFEARQQRQRGAVAVHRARGGTGGVDADSGDAGGVDIEEHAPDHRFDSLEIVERVLTEPAVRRVAVKPVGPAPVIVDAGGEVFAVFRIDQNRPDAVRTEIDADQKFARHALLSHQLVIRKFVSEPRWISERPGSRFPV